jgi:hypothetical protein
MHLPKLALAATLLLHPLVGRGAASTPCAVNMISIATTVTRPSAAIRAKITNVELVSIGSKYFKKYIRLIGEFNRNALFMGFLFIPVSFIGNSVTDS